MQTAKILGVGPRTASFLRSRYPRHAAKMIARDFDVSEQTARLWLAGRAPTTAYIEEMTAFFGIDYVRAVFTEAFEEHDRRIVELERLVVDAFVSGAAYGFDAGYSFAQGLLPHRSTIAAWFDWATIRLGLSRQRIIISLPVDEQRTMLVEELVRAVPALPAPIKPALLE